MIDALMIFLFVSLGLSCIMLLYCLIHVVQSVKTLGKTMTEINAIVLRANSSVDRLLDFKQKVSEPIGIISVILTILTIGLSNRLYKSFKK